MTPRPRLAARGDTTALTLAPVDTLDASGSNGSANIRPDGTLWSHAASPGQYVRDDEEFSLDFPELRNMVAVFTAGDNGASKVPIDYEHETYSKQIAGTEKVPWSRRAGEVVELVVVETREDMPPEVASQVAAEEARRARLGGTLATRPVEWQGLWARWAPTKTALTLVQNREVTEMSVTVAWDAENNRTGESLGATLLSIALTNTPFIDTMVPVAASRGAGRTPAAPGTQERQHMSADTKKRTGFRAHLAAAVAALTALVAAADAGDGGEGGVAQTPVQAIREKVAGGEGLTVEEATTLLAALDAAVAAQPVTPPNPAAAAGVAASRGAGGEVHVNVNGKTVLTIPADDAVATLTRERDTAAAFVNLVAPELGDERDPAQALARVRELRSAGEQALAAAKETEKTARTQAVAAYLTRHESRLASVAQRDYFAAALTRELEAGNVLEATEGKEVAPTASLIAGLPVVPGMEQQAGGDTGGAPVSTDEGERIDAAAKELMGTDAYKAIAQSKGFSAAFKAATADAFRQIKSGAGGAALVS